MSALGMALHGIGTVVQVWAPYLVFVAVAGVIVWWISRPRVVTTRPTQIESSRYGRSASAQARAARHDRQRARR